MICRRSIVGLRCCYRRSSLLVRWSSLPPTFSKLPHHVQVLSAIQRQHASSSLSPTLGSWSHVPTTSSLPDTIYALSTAPGRAAIAVVRISGPSCLDIYHKLCPQKPSPKPRTATLRKLYDPVDASHSPPRILDHGALVLYFSAPHTVTGENILEFHIHGGPAIVRSVLEAISKCGRTSKNTNVVVRHADPGEFTKRAFYNGKLDLTQAEALGETLAAETEQQRRLAVSGADSGLAKRYEEWRTLLLNARGELEALIDFSEDQHFDESPAEFVSTVTSQVHALKRRIDIHLQNACKGELLRNGISIALLGPPNAGKSSLLNRVVGREAAIVSAEAGTTRDIVDVTVDIGGWLCRLGDMAGLRGDGNFSIHHNKVGLVEQEGIRRARERALSSDVIVAILPIEVPPAGRPFVSVTTEVIEAVKECHSASKTVLVALNKVDMLPNECSVEDAYHQIRDDVQKLLPMIPVERISFLSCKASLDPTSRVSDPGGIQAFLKTLTGAFSNLTTASTGGTVDTLTPGESQAYWTSSLSITHRQSVYLKECRQHLNDYLADVVSNVGIENDVDLKTLHDYHVDRHDDLVGLMGSVLRDDFDIVTAAEHLRFAAQCLAKITGKGEGGDVEDVLGVVFEK